MRFCGIRDTELGTEPAPAREPPKRERSQITVWVLEFFRNRSVPCRPRKTLVNLRPHTRRRHPAFLRVIHPVRLTALPPTGKNSV